jgi:hypothetical protein
MTMASCKDCVHYELCFDYTHLKHSKDLPDNREDVCEHFKYKAKFVELPCKVGETVYCLIEGFDFVSEGRVRSITMYDNCMAVEIAVYGYYAQRRTNKDFGHSVFLTKEEAEQKLKGGADNE